jgi:23S rRNA maturation-related 3'-5' exoribonuclease YhaM
MLFAANSNRKISASLFDEMFDLELENTAVPSNHKELLKELEQLKFETSNKTIEALLKEIQQNQQKVFDLYRADQINYSFSTYQQTLHYKNIQLLRNEIKQVAIWLHDNDITTMPLELRQYFHD